MRNVTRTVNKVLRVPRNGVGTVLLPVIVSFGDGQTDARAHSHCRHYTRVVNVSRTMPRRTVTLVARRVHRVGHRFYVPIALDRLNVSHTGVVRLHDTLIGSALTSNYATSGPQRIAARSIRKLVSLVAN